MARRRTSVVKVREILRLSLKEGFSQRQVACALNVGKTTVCQTLKGAQEKGLTSWEVIESLENSDFEDLIPAEPSQEPKKPSKIQPEWAQIRLELQKKGATLLRLWQEYEEGEENTLCYSSFCSQYRSWVKRSRLSLRQIHVPGEKVFVDFSGLTLSWHCLQQKKIHKAEIFVATLGSSSYTFVKALPSQKTEDWLYAHVDAFEFFGGTPQIVVPDNLRSAVSKTCRYDPQIQSAYASLGEHYGVTIMPARAYHPKDKAKVEVAVQVIERWILFVLRKRTFYSLGEINEEISKLLISLNQKPMRHLGVSREELWQLYEKPVLKPLPAQRFDIPVWKSGKVNIDYHVEYKRYRYSVPYTYIGQQVRIKITRSLVEVYTEQAVVIARHARLLEGHSFYSTVAEHMPPQHAEHEKWTPERILQWAQRSGGPQTHIFCAQLMGSRTHPQQGFRACLGVMRLLQRHSPSEMESACTYALEKGMFSYQKIADHLKQQTQGNQKKTSTKKPSSLQLPIPVPHHENIRGPKYYS